MNFNPADTALVVTDPQIDFLSPDGVAWELVGHNVEDNDTVAHLEQLFARATAGHYKVFVSPHYYYPHDHQWEFGGTLEEKMHEIGMFDRPGPLNMEGFQGSGADWMPQYKPYLESGRAVICSPHKVYGPEANDLVLQLRKRGDQQGLLAGMSANLCVESHLRELLEQGFRGGRRRRRPPQPAPAPPSSGRRLRSRHDELPLHRLRRAHHRGGAARDRRLTPGQGADVGSLVVHTSAPSFSHE